MTHARTTTDRRRRHTVSPATVRAALRACAAGNAINRQRLAALAAAFNLFGEPAQCPTT